MLGPLSVYDGSGWVGIGSAKSRLLLATLLIRTGAVVSLEQVIVELWGAAPPKSAATQVHGYVMRLRRLLGDRDGRLLITEAPGYRLAVGRQDVDVQLFESHVDKGERALRDGDNERAVMLFGAALALWRGAPLSDVDSTQLVADEAGRLTERRLSAWEARTDAELALGQHATLIGELRHHLEAHPLRERPWRQLMLSLYRGGRQAEALQAFQRLRRIFLDELGVEPSAPLRELHQRLLVGDLAASPAPAWVPRQLPAAPRFIGRADELARLDTLRDKPIAITGQAGIGKTALAAYWASRVRDRFPDGQLYVNLRGHDPNPSVAPAAVLAHFLQALGVVGTDMPRDPAGRAALYRELLAGRRVLVFLDNAGAADQVRPLLPDAASCLAVITSRDELRELDASRLRLGVLSDADAAGLLTSVLGADRATGDAVAELAALCGHLPLALRIAAANVAARPQQTIDVHLADLREGNRLTELSVPGDRQAAVRAAFDLSYAALSTSDQQLFRRLGLIPGVDFTPAVAAALMDGPAERSLDRLAAAHVIEPGAAGRYALHDLLRIYAGERAAADPDAEPARRRLFDYYLGMARGAAGSLNPGLAGIPLPDEEPAAEFGGYDEALAWLDAERANLTAMIKQAGAAAFSWRLGYALRSYFWTRRTGDEWVELAHAGLAAAQADASAIGQAGMYLSLGHAHWCVGDYREAIGHYTRARSHCQRLGWRLGESSALNGLAVAFGQLGQLEQTIDHLTEALRIDREQGAGDNVARRLNNLGFALQTLGRLEEAADHYRQSLALRRELGDRAGQWGILNHLAQIHRLLGEPDKALDLLAEALSIGKDTGSDHATAVALRNIAAVHHDRGRHDLAKTHAEQALPLARDSGDHEIHVGVLNVLGESLAGLGEHAEADRRNAEVLEITSQSGFLQGRVDALIGLATLRRRQGRHDVSAELASEALTLAHQHKLRLAEGRAHLELATALVELGRRDHAADHARQALAVQRDTGHRPGEERAIALLDQLLVQ
jgi:DNA-binding SARP family transcriptional activator/tetratricopeptide (TPR) repeat protein